MLIFLTEIFYPTFGKQRKEIRVLFKKSVPYSDALRRKKMRRTFSLSPGALQLRKPVAAGAIPDMGTCSAPEAFPHSAAGAFSG